MNVHIHKNKKLNMLEALIPVFFLMIFLSYNIFFANGALMGSYTNQIILIASGIVASFIGLLKKVSISVMIHEIWHNLKSVFIPIIILLLVGALAGSWLISGIIPAMVYYGLQVLNPTIFLPATLLICSIISIATGSSWTTSATVGIALIGIGTALAIPTGMIAGAVVSGAYFGDKLSPLSDTTNLAPAMAGTDLFTHIRYMTLTTVPTYIITLLVFTILSLNIKTTGITDISGILDSINNTFYISPILFIVPAIVIALILFKTKPIIALGTGIILALLFALFFQPQIIDSLSNVKIIALLNAVVSEISIETANEKLNELFSSKGMLGMVWTILLIISAMFFGGIMDAIGALEHITTSLLSYSKSIFGLFASTVISCLGLNIVASDQYLALVIPGKMFKKAYHEKGLAPENLSRTLEDTGTVTSALIPWNTCGAYQSGVLGVAVNEYFIYAIFNWLSPIMTIIFAAFNIKIKQLISVIK
ncbi:MAG TPA: Na+/H+ antiporter NhaC [Flavobacterium sp.]|nr:Na+/H+ antiporter NhaC [Flavobacterium sp.]